MKIKTDSGGRSRLWLSHLTSVKWAFSSSLRKLVSLRDLKLIRMRQVGLFSAECPSRSRLLIRKHTWLIWDTASGRLMFQNSQTRIYRSKEMSLEGISRWRCREQSSRWSDEIHWWQSTWTSQQHSYNGASSLKQMEGKIKIFLILTKVALWACLFSSEGNEFQTHLLYFSILCFSTT